MDPRIIFTTDIIINKKSGILELGPLNRPIVTKDEYPNSFYGGIRSTEEVKQLYSGNDYLESTGIHLDQDTIVNIDFVIKENYAQAFAGQEKFDYILASHVLEHMEDLIFSLNNIASVLTKTGRYFDCCLS